MPICRAVIVLIISFRFGATLCAQERRVVGYFAGWSVYQRNYHPADIPADRLTHVNYAFARIIDGRCDFIDRKAAVERVYPGDAADLPFHGSFQQLRLLRAKHAHLKTLISVGGWADSGGFSDAALTDDSRRIFARSCVDFAVKYGFDGVDIDWEFPGGGGVEGNKFRREDTQNFTSMLAELRGQLDERGKADGRAYLLTIAAPAGHDTYARIELAKIHAYLDWINLMTYDFAGEWSERTGFNAPLYAAREDPGDKRRQRNVDAAVTGYLAAGVPADKIVVGIPFYGKSWGGVADVNHGLFQKHAKSSGERGLDYRNLAANYVDKRGTRYWHEQAKAPWLFDEKKGLMICYDDEQSVTLKCQYVLDHKLGGVMFWELSEDDGTLTGAVDRVFKPK
jgi:chitinase